MISDVGPADKSETTQAMQEGRVHLILPRCAQGPNPWSIRPPEIDVSERRECCQDLSDGGPAITAKIVAAVTYCSEQNNCNTVEPETA